MRKLFFNSFVFLRNVLLLTLFAFAVGGTQSLTVQARSESSLIPSMALPGENEQVSASNRVVFGFIENVGQFEPSGRFYARLNPDHRLWLAEDGLWLTLVEQGDRQDQGVNLKLSFVGANPIPRLEPFHAFDSTISYLTGSRPANWRANVPVWGGVRYVEFYPGLDLEVLTTAGAWDWRVVCKTNCQNALPDVRLRVEGADTLTVEDAPAVGNALQLDTALGELTLPLLQVIDSEGSPLAVPAARPTVNGVEVEAPFAPAFQRVEPLAAQSADHGALQGTSNLVYSAFLGGSGNDCFPDCAITVDGGGGVYLTGHTVSTDFPTRPGAFSLINQNGDFFVVKVNVDGNGFDYATFVGGSGLDYGLAIAVDGSGHAYVAGYTNSEDFPTTEQVVGATYRGGYSDAFVVKLEPNGAELTYATLLGGENIDRAYGVAVDNEGRAYVIGETKSANFTTTPNALDFTYNDNSDIFVVELGPTGRTLNFATFLGGEAEDVGQAIAVDLLGQVYLTGKTNSTDFPTTEAALAPLPNGLADAFVVKLDPGQGKVVYATFLGGDSTDAGEAITVDSEGNVYLTGSTISSDFPTTTGAFETGHQGGYDAFVVKLDPTGSELVYGTFLGGKSGDRSYAIAIDSAGSAYVTGSTFSQNFPTTPGAFDSTYNYGYADAFAVKLEPDGAGLAYATFLGGSEPDYGTAIAVDGEGSAYLAGATLSPTFPATVRGFDPEHNGGWDGFVTKIGFTGQAKTSLISGIIRDQQGNAVPGVVIKAGASGSTTTDANGVYALIGLDPGTYTLTPVKSGYTFSPAQRTINIPTEENLLVFTGVARGDPPESFLDLPLDYGDSVSNFVQFLQDTDSQGWITSWFDHAYPDYGKNKRLALVDGLFRTKEGYNLNLGCYERRCYDGHNGTDFIYRDFRPGLQAAPAVEIRAAAAGEVVDTRTGCRVGNRRCGFGYGNFVVLDHQNGYFTMYGHLSQLKVRQGDTVEQSQVVGFMGNTGNSTGFHLHFGVYQDDGNGQWDGDELDKPVDPFGWRGSQADPWVVDRQGPTSYPLWQYPLSQQKSFVGSQGVTLADTTGAIETVIPADAFTGQASLELLLGAAPHALPGHRSAGHSFRLSLLEWLPGSSGAAAALAGVNPAAALAKSITLSAVYTVEDVRHLDIDELSFYRWDETGREWQPLPSTINQESQIVTAQIGSLGQFDLQAPLICPADSVESDDNYFSARSIEPGGEPISRLFDTAEDEDWFYFETVPASKYVIETSQLGSGVDTRLELFNMADGALLAADDNSGFGAASRLEWPPTREGTFFIRVTSAPDSAAGCRATYSLTVTYERYKLYLPLVMK